MTDPLVQETIPSALARLAWPLRLTRAGMLAERLARSFWPLWSLLLVVAATLAFGVQDRLSVEAAWIGLMLAAAGLIWALYAGLRAFVWPTQGEALARLDQTLPGRPIAALTDQQVIGAADPASVAVWRAHTLRMAARAAKARAPEPDLRLARRDHYGLRYVALTAFVMALIFGSLWRVAAVTDIVAGQGGPVQTEGPTWEGWLQPPAYTGKPSLYLNDIAAITLTVPIGTKVTLRLYGEVGDLTLAETVSGRVGDLTAGEVTAASAPSQEFEVTRPGTIRIDGPGGREWAVRVTPDAPPQVSLSGEITREADGRMTQPFSARDDYAVLGGRAEIALDLAAVDRRFGLTVAPEPREMLVLDLPMPISGSRAEFTEDLIDDLSQHPFANLPVTLTLFANDALAQTGRSEPEQVILPGRRFFDPLAAGLIEMRRDLMWSRQNGHRASQILRTLTHRPEGLIRNEGAYLQLRTAMRRLQAGVEADAFTTELRDEVAQALWDVAIVIEDGDLADAKARLDRAQDRLSEAIRNGANEQEIAKLMQELNEAMQDYMQQLAEQSPPESGLDTAQNQNSMEITQDQMQAMLDELQKLMEEGRMAEAAELLEQLRQLMENMQVTQGEGGQGSPGQQALRGLADTLRDQQGLSDDAFSDLQRQFNPGQQPGQGQPGQGQPGQDQQGQGKQGQGENGQGDNQPGQNLPGQDGQGNSQPGESGRGPNGGGDDPSSLAERQEALRQQLESQQRGLPGAGTAEGDAAREALGRAEQAMREAEDALRGNDIPGAIDRQAEAMEALRDGMRAIGEAMAQNQLQPGQQDGQALGDASPRGQQDPLGRDLGGMGRAGTQENLLQGDDVYRRAREILDELRRRSSDKTRPETELDYLDRLLDRF